MISAGRRVLAALEIEWRANFDPGQPRDEFGRWTDEGVSTESSTADAIGEVVASGDRVRVAGAFDWGQVDVRDEEGYRGGHTIREHVGKSDSYMLARVRGETYNIAGVVVVGLTRSGSFSSIQAANSLINSTLARNADVVEAVASGRSASATVVADFGSITGSEAYRATSLREPYIRATTGVEVVIYHDSKQLKGFRVLTAYRSNN